MAFPELCEAGVTVNDGKRPSCFGHKSAGFCFFFVVATSGAVLGPWALVLQVLAQRIAELTIAWISVPIVRAGRTAVIS
jgi:hypothetical protein